MLEDRKERAKVDPFLYHRSSCWDLLASTLKDGHSAKVLENCSNTGNWCLLCSPGNLVQRTNFKHSKSFKS